MTLNNLYDLASTKDITVATMPLPYLKGVSTVINGDYYIGLNCTETKNTVEEKEVLAHEMGHCITGAFYNVYSPYDIKARHEGKADKWAIRKLIPLHELKYAINSGFTEFWELAEYFEVPERFLIKALKFYEDSKCLGKVLGRVNE